MNGDGLWMRFWQGRVWHMVREVRDLGQFAVPKTVCGATGDRVSTILENPPVGATGYKPCRLCLLVGGPPVLGEVIDRMGPDKIAAFWMKVDRSGGPDACWPWMAARSKSGYGTQKVFPYKVLAHRLALALSVLPASEDLLACHRCDNPPCVNPAHLYWGTDADNLRDRLLRGTATQPPRTSTDQCVHGHMLTPESTYYAPSAPNKRRCRACHRERNVEYRARQRDAR